MCSEPNRSELIAHLKVYKCIFGTNSHDPDYCRMFSMSGKYDRERNTVSKSAKYLPPIYLGRTGRSTSLNSRMIFEHFAIHGRSAEYRASTARERVPL